ncbi:uncharacterized protein LOC133915945 [Phragmites australis]|uniref:uncharacterized protein LOC133915945 n=1 Tax=Phragmites australis TaxID=29695 RepID=UPI002D771A9F|nr:uncharacterized protein LOC133915945 [Phragmites australis]
MALSEFSVAALISLVTALLLLAHALQLHQPSRLRSPGATLAGLLLSALDRFHGRSLLDLATRRNMILLCHVIVLVILKDTGILSTPARRRAGAATTNIADAAAARERPHARSIVVWRPRNRAAPAASSGSKNAAVTGSARLMLDETAATRCTAPTLTEPEHGEKHVATREIIIVEERRNNYLLDHHGAAVVEHEQATAVDGSESSRLDIGRVLVADDDVRNTAREETAEVELADDRRFEEFIANTRRRMQLESLQLVKVVS